MNALFHLASPMRRLAFVLAAGLMLFASLAAHAQEEENRRLDVVKASLDQIEAELERGHFDDPALGAIAARIEAARTEIAKVQDALGPRLQAINTRLEQLGPPPAEGAPPESPELAQERAALQQQRQPFDEVLKRAAALTVQADQLLDKVTQKRREEFANRVLARSYSLLDPTLWLNVAKEAPRRIAAVQALAEQWLTLIHERMTLERGLILGGALLLALIIFWPVRAWIQRFGQRYAAEQAPATRLRRSSAALWVVLIRTAAPIAAALIVYYGLILPGFAPDRVVPFLGRLVRIVALVAFVAGLTRAVLAPGRPSWRLPPISDETATRLAHYPIWIVGIFALSRSIQALFDVTGVGLSTTIAIDGVAATAVALVAALAIRPVKAAETEEAHSEGEEFWLFGTARLVAWTVIVAVLVAVVSGYVSLGFFLATQLIWLSVLAGMLYILLTLTDDLLCGWGPQSRIMRMARTTIGLRAESFDQLCALASGLLRLALIVIALLLAAAPWGIQSDDATGWIRRAFTGISLNGLSVSPGAILGALAFLVGGLLLTKAIQRWLDTRYLPHTRLDEGLKNSIRTATGYAGVFLAAGLAISSLGFGLDRLAIVAGALSVGIGFGLQSVVSNFVSGLILLAERPIKVGDWVGVGADEGNVRRISVRSTAVELFDHSTLIIPNTDLITKPVRNWTHRNPVGRVLLKLGVGHAGKVTEVRQILLMVATEHPSVLSQPPPEAAIIGTTDLGVQWSLICHVPTPRQVAATRADLYFAILQRLQAQSVPITASPP